MSNRVVLGFEGKDLGVFAMADAVEKRAQNLKVGANAASPAALAEQKALTAILEREELKRTSVVRAANKAAVASREAALAAVIAAEKAETKVVQIEAAKRAAARSSAAVVPTAGSSGKSLTSTLAGTAGVVIGGAAATAAVLTFREIINVTEEGEKRIQAFRAELIGLSTDAATAAAESAKFAAANNLSLGESAQIYAKSLKLAQDNSALTGQIAKSAADVGALRNLSAEEIARGLEDVNRGLANQSLFGENAESILDQYASTVGKTAEELTALERRQALMNELLHEGAQSAGLQAEKILTLSGSFDHLKNSVEQFFSGAPGTATGGIATGIRAVGDFFTSGFNFQQTRRDRDAAIAKAQADRKVQEVRDAQAVADKIAQANANPRANIESVGITQFLNQADIATLSPRDQEEQIRKAVTAARGFKTNLEKEVAVALQSGDTGRIKGKVNSLQLYKGLFSDEELTDLGKKAAETISNNLKSQLSRSLARTENVGDLRRLRGSIIGAIDLTPKDKQGLLDDVTKKIESSIEKLKHKIKEMGDAFKSAFEGVAARAAAGNPFLVFLTEADKRTRQLKEQTKGFSAELRKTIFDMNELADQRERIGLRFDAALQANDLRNQAQEFRQGFKTGGFPSSKAEFVADFNLQQQAERATRNLLPPGLFKKGLSYGFTAEQQKAHIEAFRSAAQQDFINAEKNKTIQSQIDQQLGILGLGAAAKQLTKNPASLNPNQIIGGSLIGPNSFLDPNQPFQIQNALRQAQAPRTALDDEKRIVAEQKLIALAQNVDPSKLRPDQQNAIATALENEAKRKLDAEKVAVKKEAERAKVLTSLDEQLKALVKLAQDGKLSATVKFVNKSDRVEISTTGSQTDVASTYGT